MYRFLLVFTILLKSSTAVIYSLNESDYNKMPALYNLDDFSSCLLEPDGTYCLADFGLFGKNKELLNMIHGYSEYRLKHFNHTQIHRGVCVTSTCKDYIVYTSVNRTVDLKKTLEACTNASIHKDYNLQVKLENIQYCKKAGEKLPVDGYDIFVALIILFLLSMNVVGTLYDSLLQKKGLKNGNPYLLAFSIQRNWKKMVAPSARGIDARMDRLKLFHGMRTMTMICVFFSHTVLVMAYAYVDNPLFIEKAYEDPLKQILFNGTLVTHTFFVMSAFLLSYNLELYAEKHPINWRQWPKGILMRWLRLTPVYALVLALVCTWMRHMGSGPMWELVVESESMACRQYWWAHLLYINNYLYSDTHCAPQTWYLAADTQLFAFGLLLCVLFRTSRSRIIALGVSFVIALVIVALHTYLEDLEAVVLQSPETYRELYAHDKTFRITFVRGHTNMSTYILGLTGGFLTYHWQKQKKELSTYKRHKWIFWLMFPLGVFVILTGGFFYRDGPKSSIAVRVIYATIYKPIFQMLVAGILIGCIFKVDTLYRGVMEWRGFTWTGRVSYSAFLLHTLFQRGLVGGQPRTTYMSDYYIFTVLSSTIFMAFIGAALLWMCVESPVSTVTRALLSPPRKRGENDEEQNAD